MPVGSCLAIIASICLSQPATAKLTSSTVWTGAEIELDGVSIRSEVGSDNIIDADHRKMAKACSKGTCVWYWMRCEAEKARQHCQVYYAWPGTSSLRRIDLRYDTEDQLARATRYVSLVPDTSDGAVRWDELKVRAPQWDPPFCRGDASACRSEDTVPSP